MYTVEQAPRELNFGRQGESNILSYQFDFSQWAEDWPGGLASMTVILPNQTQPQPIPDTQAVVDGTIITLHVLDNLTEKDGRGTLIIRYVAGTNKKRSRLIEFVVEKGHETQVGSELAVVEDWVDEAVETLNDVKSLTFTINDNGELLAGETVLGRVSDNPRGNYNPDADPLYSKRDIVFDNGGSYRYINDTPSNEPTSSTTHWQQIASRGMTSPSAYDAAVAGGYTGTEAEFNAANAGIEAAETGRVDAENIRAGFYDGFATQLAKKANAEQGAWITPTMLNTWASDVTRTLCYRKTSIGTVQIKGWTSGGTVGARAFNLPVGYRPSHNRGYAVWAEVGYGRVYVSPSGDVVPFGPSTTAGLYVEIEISL